MSQESLLSYLASVVFLVVFYFIERRHPEPIIDFKFFKNSAFVLILLNTFFVFMGMMGSVFLIPLFAQTFLGYDATSSGYLFVPMALFIFIAAPIGAYIARRIPPGVVIGIGTLIGAVGLFLMSHTLDVRMASIGIIAPLSLMALGMGAGMSSRTNIIASSVPQNEVGVASSIFVLVRNLAGAFGVAISTSLLAQFAENNVIRISDWSNLYTTNSFVHSEFIKLITTKAQIDAFRLVFVVAALMLVVGGVLAFWVNVDRQKKGEVIIPAK